MRDGRREDLAPERGRLLLRFREGQALGHARAKMAGFPEPGVGQDAPVLPDSRGVFLSGSARRPVTGEQFLEGREPVGLEVLVLCGFLFVKAMPLYSRQNPVAHWRDRRGGGAADLGLLAFLPA